MDLLARHHRRLSGGGLEDAQGPGERRGGDGDRRRTLPSAGDHQSGHGRRARARAARLRHRRRHRVGQPRLVQDRVSRPRRGQQSRGVGAARPDALGWQRRQRSRLPATCAAFAATRAAGRRQNRARQLPERAGGRRRHRVERDLEQRARSHQSAFTPSSGPRPRRWRPRRPRRSPGCSRSRSSASASSSNNITNGGTYDGKSAEACQEFVVDVVKAYVARKRSSAAGGADMEREPSGEPLSLG